MNATGGKSLRVLFASGFVCDCARVIKIPQEQAPRTPGIDLTQNPGITDESLSVAYNFPGASKQGFD